MARRSKSHPREVALLGVAITLGALGAQALGWFDVLERRSIDVRYQRARLHEMPMSDQVRHVDIDDHAINTVGRWPWPRSKVADALEELHRAGAAVVAVDVKFDVPQEVEYRPVAGGAVEAVDHDARLAAALGAGRSVVAVQLASEPLAGTPWEARGRRDELRRLVDVQRRDVQAPMERVAAEAGVTGERAALAAEHERLVRDAAAAAAADELLERTGGLATFEDFQARVAPSVDAHTGDYPERLALVRAWEQRRAWRTLRPMHRASAQEWRVGVGDQAPMPAFASGAAAAGFVDAEYTADDDGVLRSLSVVRDGPAGEALQFGLASAAALMGLTPADVEVGDGSVRVGETRLPTRDGRILLDWPGPGRGPLNLLRRGEESPAHFGHISMAGLVRLAEERRKLEALRERLMRAAGEMTLLPEGQEPTEETVRRARETVERRMAERDELLATGEALTDEEREVYYRFEEFARLDESVREGEAALAQGSQAVESLMRGRLVFVGWTATGAAADFVKTALHPRTPGVIVHAVAADMALTGRASRLPPAWATYALIAAMGALGTWAVAALAPAATAGAALGLLAAYAAVAGVGLFNWWPGAPPGVGALVPIVAPMSACFAAWVGCTALEAALAQRDRQRIERQFKARVSGQLVEFLVRNPGAMSVSGETREVTSVFVDLAGFTAISERLGGPETVALLNRAMREMTRALIAEGAYVNKFLGDGLMAFWSAFGPEPEQARRACRAALACVRAVDAMREGAAIDGVPPLRARVGVATGAVVVGDCGAPPDLNDYTVIGDAVNLAARLESANKQFGSRILIDGRTRTLLEKIDPETDGFVVRSFGRVVVVGQSTPTEVFEVLPADTPSERVELTARAVRQFQQGDYLSCLATCNVLAETFGDAKLQDVFREGVADAPDADEPGVIRLRAK